MSKNKHYDAAIIDALVIENPYVKIIYAIAVLAALFLTFK